MHLNQASSYKANILVVDDTPDNLRLLSAMLTAQGYDVRKALNGKMALTACQMLLPDIILLDINMPEMDGYEVCRQIKADKKISEVPVIFISALDDVLDKVKAFSVGGVDYITKPFYSQEVVSRIENQISLRLLQIRLREKNFLLEKTLEELKAAQVQQIQNEKMVALGHFVAGIAHEINNPISFIYGNLQYANEYMEQLVNLIQTYQQEYPNPTQKIQKIVTDIDLNFLINDLQNIMNAMYRGSERIRSIVLGLRNFSRLDEAQMKQVDIHKGIDSTLSMLEHRLVDITVIKEYGDLPRLNCYPSELNQVFMHLLNNAIDALNISASEMPKIYIRTEVTNSKSVKILFADNGCGIDETVLPRIFDPFFTTKPPGKGSGLGLSISYQIVVQKHHGQLACNSKLGEGAEFIIHLPNS